MGNSDFHRSDFLGGGGIDVLKNGRVKLAGKSMPSIREVLWILHLDESHKRSLVRFLEVCLHELAEDRGGDDGQS